MFFAEVPRNAGGSKMLLVGGTVLACFFMLAAALYFFRMKRTEAAWFAIALLVLIGSFVGVYAAFYGQAGLPAGEGLSSADWLSFLGGYLGFAGSLIMAWLVYRQDTKLKELTMEEYAAAFSCKIRGVQQARDTKKEREQVFGFWEQEPQEYRNYFKHDAFPEAQEAQEAGGKLVTKIFLSLQNAGKLPVREMLLEKVEIQPYEKQEKLYRYNFTRENGGNILNGKHELLPEGMLNLCLVMHSLPEKLEFSSFRLTFSFELGAKRKEQTILFYIQVNQGSDAIVSDGENVF